MKRLVGILIILVSVFAAMLAEPAYAQPVNDSFANAITLEGPIVTTTGSNVGATKPFGPGGEPSIPPPSLGTFGGASVWWSWTAAASGETTIDTEGSDFNTLLGVFTGDAPNQLTLVAGNNDFEANLWSRVVFNAIAGTTYRIMVDGFRSGPGFGSPAMGNIQLNIKGVGGLTITTPTPGMVFTVGDPIPIELIIDDDFPNPPATQVDFYLGNTLVSSSTTPPYTAVANNAPAGSNRVYAVAFDSTGAPIQSAVIPIFVQSIGVTLLTPFDGTTFLTTDPISVTAWAYLPSGSITNVEFFVDNVKFGESSTAPFAAVWDPVVSGSHRLTAVGRSDAGVAYNSQPANIAVAQLIVASNSVWKYLDDGSDQGTAWYATDFDDSGWQSGPAPLGYGDSNGRPPLTTNSFGPDPNAKYVTTYYRQSFTAENLASFTNIVLSLQRDDGAIIYLNGEELARFNMPTSQVTFATPAVGNANDDGGTTFSISVNPNLLNEGSNVFAVEIHQDDSGNSSDIWFVMQLLGVPPVIYNLAPSVEITNLEENQYFLGPASITIEADAADEDGTVVKVEFFADDVMLGESTTSPYSVVWDNPPLGPHTLTAKATDDGDGFQVSSPIPVVVYDAAGTPFGRITRPADGAAIEGGTNLLLTAYANAPDGVTSVQFLSNGAVIGTSDTEPYSLVWDAPFGDHTLTVVVTDTTGATGTSAPVTINVFPNSTPPTVEAQMPVAGATVSSLTNLTVTFSEPVQNVQAADLLVNGVPALAVTGSGARYVFTFSEPPYGPVAISWATGQAITDFGYPADLPFDETGEGAQWNYLLVDRTPPVVAVRMPAAGTTVTELQELSVTFSEPVSGVDASDLIVAGTPAFSMSGGGSTYTFLVSQPNSGTVNVSWATNSEIFDLSDVPNAFAPASGGWNFVLNSSTVLLQSNAVWFYYKGESEPTSDPTTWRQPGFEVEDEWFEGQAPFFFGDPYTNNVITGTYLSDMSSNYTTIYLRTEFVVTNLSVVTNLYLNHQSDDGFIAWLNGVEVFRYNAPPGQVPYNGTASTQAGEPGNAGAAYISVALPAGPTNLVNGTNVLAVHALNQSQTSSDFGFNAQLYTLITDPTKITPSLVAASPTPGDLLELTSITVTFSEPVSGVDAADLLINGVPATGLSSTTNTIYTFSFTQPPYGPVAVTWAADHRITDFDNPPKPFIGTANGSTFNYTLFNPINPRIAGQVPAAGNIITSLTSVAVSFTKPVTGVDAADFLINGAPALSVSSSDQTTYVFTVTQPSYGTVNLRWSTNHAIVDLEDPPNAFDATRFGAQWSYRLVNPVPTVAITSPANNSSVLAPTITLRATATDGDGTITRVEFFENTAGKLGEALTSPYTYIWDNVEQGPYTLWAVATDNSGIMATSPPVVINVVTSLPIVLVRGPYLQLGSPTAGTVRWRSDLFSDAVVFYGTDPANLTNYVVRRSLTNEHIVEISGLEPETKYYYSIGNSAQRLAEGPDYWFETSPTPGTRKPTRIWVLGDAGTAGNGAPDRQESTRDAFYSYAQTNGSADIWLMLGDNAYNSGTDSEHQAAVFDMYPTFLRNKFLWPALGNHETSQSTTATDFPYLHIFSLPTAGEAGGVPSGTEKYYSFDYGNIHFVCLDSMTSGRTSTSAMANWLRSDLESTAQEWIIVYFHHPPYTKGSHDSDAEGDLAEIRQNLVPILEENGVDLVLSGHSHCYERSYLLNGHYGSSGSLTDAMKLDGGDGREEGTGAYVKNTDGRGVVYTVAGSSGQATGGQLNHPAHFISLNELGSVIIDVSGDRLDMRFLNANGAHRDHVTLLKATAPPAPSSLLARGLGASEIELTWSDEAIDEQGYYVERSMDGIGYSRVATNAADVTAHFDTGLLANTTYYYRVVSYSERGESEPSVVASATTVIATSAPAAPVGLVARPNNAGQAYRSQMFLAWLDRSSNESGFVIERSHDGDQFVPLTTVGANVASYIDRQLESATTYYYRVRSINALGDSLASNSDGDQTHPQSDLIVAGESAVFHAGVEGVAPLSYQWRFNGVPITGATNETLVLDNAQAADEGAYAVRVTDANGSEITNPAWLFVLQPPQIVEHPADAISGTDGTAIFRVVATGTEPMFYQWRKDGQELVGAYDPYLTLGPLSLADVGDYDVIVFNSYGSVVSQVAHLEVTDNRPPALPMVADYVIDVLQHLVLAFEASDPNLTDQLTYVLEPGAPLGATLNPATGLFHWFPAREQAATTNLITVTVHDNGYPDLTASESFIVVVNDYLEITIGSAIASAGTATNSVPIHLDSSAELSEVQILLEASPEYLSNLSLEPLETNLVMAAVGPVEGGHTLLTFTAVSGQLPLGNQPIALLHFTAGANSAFVPLTVLEAGMAMDAPGLTPSVLANHGRVVVIGDQSLLEAKINSAGRRTLVMYGKVGTAYTLESRFGSGSPWLVRSTFTMTSQMREQSAPSPTAPLIFFRLRQ